MKLKQKFTRIALLAVLLSFQFLFFGLIFSTSVQAQNNTNANLGNSGSTNPTEGTYVGKGVEASIRALLCAPTSSKGAPTTTTAGTTVASSNPAEDDLAKCINRGYRFALAFGAVAAVFFVVLAGYMYMVGGEKGKEEGKHVITSVLVGFLIMISSFVLLQQINPSLTSFRTIQTPTIGGTYKTLPDCAAMQLGEDCILPDGTPAVADGSGGGTPNPGGGGGGCRVTTGSHACSVDRMAQCPAWANQKELASRICNLESGGGRNLAVGSGSDKCKDGNSWSFGLFQINIIAHGGERYMPSQCPSGIFEKRGSGGQGTCMERNRNGICIKYDCNLKAGMQSTYNSCIQALANADVQMRIACGLYTRRGNWGDWATSYKKCK